MLCHSSFLDVLGQAAIFEVERRTLHTTSLNNQLQASCFITRPSGRLVLQSFCVSLCEHKAEFSESVS